MGHNPTSSAETYWDACDGMIPVGLLDNLLKPVLMARGLATPMPVIVIGVIGGTIAYGIIGLFFGPIVLSVAWKLITAWLYGGDGKSEKQARSHAQVANAQKAD
jgi:predicted PurR-regulated permease PerM